MTTAGMTLQITPSACKRATGLTMAELQVVVAVHSCWRAHAGHPTRQSIQQITGGGRGNLPSQLCEIGVLRQVERTSERWAVYAVTDSWVAALGLDTTAEAAE